jgi:hypothetical protein
MRSGYYCKHKDWDWDVRYPIPYYYFARKATKVVIDKYPKSGASTDYMCWGCYTAGGTSCNN